MGFVPGNIISTDIGGEKEKEKEGEKESTCPQGVDLWAGTTKQLHLCSLSRPWDVDVELLRSRVVRTRPSGSCRGTMCRLGR